MKIACAWEHNGNDTLLHAITCPGAFTRGANFAAAIEKMPVEVRSYLLWKGVPTPQEIAVEIAEDYPCELAVCDADSDILFHSEKDPLDPDEYLQLKALALQSASDFLYLYRSIPDKHRSCQPERKTFYGFVPRTAEEMYQHTKNVNAYYFGEIDVPASNDGTILDCRLEGFALLEKMPDFLSNPIHAGSYGEGWTLRKVLRRFLWPDRIHAKAMYRMAVEIFGCDRIPDPFHFAL